MGIRRSFGAVVIGVAVCAVTLVLALGASAKDTHARTAPTIGGLPLLTLHQVLDPNVSKLTQLLSASQRNRRAHAPLLRIPTILNGVHSCPVDAGYGAGCDARTCTEYIAVTGSCSRSQNGDVIGPQVIGPQVITHTGRTPKNLLAPVPPENRLTQSLPRSLAKTFSQLRSSVSGTG